MTRRARADAATIDRRVNHITTLILNGETTSKIRQNPTIKRWHLDNRTIDRYIHQARENIRAQGEFDKVDEFGKAIARLERLYNAAVTAKPIQIGEARAIIKQICQLYGIDGPIHVKVGGGVTVTTFAEVAKRAAEQAAAQKEHEA